MVTVVYVLVVYASIDETLPELARTDEGLWLLTEDARGREDVVAGSPELTRIDDRTRLLGVGDC